MSETVRLKNGSEEAVSLVAVTTLTLQELFQADPIAFYELVQICRDSAHRPFGITGEVLQDRHLLQPDGRVHETIRNIVLSATEGSGFDLRLTEPRA